MKTLAYTLWLSALVALVFTFSAASVHAQGRPGPGGMGPMT